MPRARWRRRAAAAALLWLALLPAVAYPFSLTGLLQLSLEQLLRLDISERGPSKAALRTPAGRAP